MKNIVKIGVFVLAASLFCSCTVNRPEQKIRTISVTGTSKIQVPSDIEVVEFVVTTSGWSAKQIVQDNDVITARFLNGVKEVGIPESDISQTECVITNPNNYEARRNVIIKVKNLSLVPQVIDCKTALIRLKSVDFETVDTASEIRSARTKAVQSAQDAAGLFSGASGCKLGNVVSIESEEIETSKTDDHKLEIKAKVKICFEIAE